MGPVVSLVVIWKEMQVKPLLGRLVPQMTFVRVAARHSVDSRQILVDERLVEAWHWMGACRLYERESWDSPISCDVVDDAYDLHGVVAAVPGVIEVGVEMAEACLHIGTPSPAHTLVMFPYPVQAAGTAGAFVEVSPGLAVG